MLLTGHAEWAMTQRENGCKEIKLLVGKSYHQLVAWSMQRAAQKPLVLKTAETSTLQQWLRDVNLVQLLGGKKNYMVQEKRVGTTQIKAMVITK